MNKEKILAIDYGTVRIGLAMSYGSLAEPLKIIAAGENSLQEIQAITASERITKIVFGLSENEMAAKTQQFAAQVAAATQVPVDFFDETLSSYEVTQNKKLTSKKSPRRQHIDHLAAALILQNYLDAHPSHD